MKILIKNGKLVDPANDVDAFYDVLIDGDKVADVAQDIDPEVLGEVSVIPAGAPFQEFKMSLW